MRDPRRTFWDVYETVRKHGRFSDSPRDRLEALVGNMLASPTLPNVVLGGFVGGVVSHLTGQASLMFVAAWALAYLVSVVVYMLGDELRAAYAAASESLDESEDTPGYE